MNSLNTNILRLIIQDIQAVLRDVTSKVSLEPNRYLNKIQHNNKPALEIDVAAENEFKELIEAHSPESSVYGEETNDEALNLHSTDKICALVDMVDGTDLLERGLGNWCSSAVFFHPQNPTTKKILGAFIGIPEGQIYFSTNTSEQVFVIDGNNYIRRVKGCSKVKTLENSSICFYGQKGEHLFMTVNCKLFEELSNNNKLKTTRIYNLAGMPMMVKMIDKINEDCNGIDAVFEMIKQKPHDFVPGAFLLKKAGAFILDRDTGLEMTDSQIEEKLMKPFVKESESRYVAASTKDLAVKIHRLLD